MRATSEKTAGEKKLGEGGRGGVGGRKEEKR